MGNTIIRETTSEMKLIAKKALRGNWATVIAALAIYYFLVSTLPLLIDELIPGAVYHTYDENLGQSVSMPVVSTLYNILLAGPFEVGLMSFLIYFFRRRELNLGHLFDGFEHFIKCLLLVVLVGCYTFFWSLLFIIPGIIAAIRYSQAFFILADHPEMSVSDCIRLSKHYMAGNKGKYFVFMLSYFGWILLSGIPFILCPELTGILYIIVDFIISIPTFIVLAYLQTGMVVFYELVSGNLMARPVEPVNVEMSSIPTLTEETEKNKDEFDF